LDARPVFATSHHLKPEHFMRVGLETVAAAGEKVKGGQHTSTSIAKNTSEMRSRLYFRLGTEVAPGYFALEPL
jgi:hypothetical protein